VETSSRKWQPIYFSIFSVTIVVTMVATVVLNGCSGCSRWLEWLEPIESATARGVLYATAIVSTIEVIRMVMLPADYLRQKFIEPLKERQKEEGREEGRTEGHAEGRVEGRAEGRAEMRAEFEAWLQRREEAEREGRDFNEPVPGTEGNSSADRNGSATKG
jgi:hypothetical protein